jgi:hypothetical protein
MWKKGRTEEWKNGRVEEWKNEDSSSSIWFGSNDHPSILPFFHPSILPFFLSSYA